MTGSSLFSRGLRRIAAEHCSRIAELGIGPTRATARADRSQPRRRAAPLVTTEHLDDGLLPAWGPAPCSQDLGGHALALAGGRAAIIVPMWLAQLRGLAQALSSNA